MLAYIYKNVCFCPLLNVLLFIKSHSFKMYLIIRAIGGKQHII